MFSLIIPVYNEEDLIDELAERAIKAVESFISNYEILFINDGSSDSTLQKLIEVRKRFPKVKIIDLSRNFGHQAAFTAGLEMAMGNYVAMMDGDLQDPPELLGEMYRMINDEGYDIDEVDDDDDLYDEDDDYFDDDEEEEAYEDDDDF